MRAKDNLADNRRKFPRQNNTEGLEGEHSPDGLVRPRESRMTRVYVPAGRLATHVILRVSLFLF